MSTASRPQSFELSTSARDDGALEAVYIRFSTNLVDRTEEAIEDVLLTDYDEAGEIVGIEILAPVTFADLEKLVDDERRQPFRRFVRSAAPSEFVTG